MKLPRAWRQNKTQNMKLDVELGTRLFLKPESCLETEPELELVTSLESVADDGHFVMYAPIGKNGMYPLSVGENLFIHCIDKAQKDKGRADFQSIVVERFKSGEVYYIRAQAVSNIAFTQRRNHFRAETVLSGTISLQREMEGDIEALACACICSDISGGGAALRFNDVNLSVGEDITLSLPVGPDGQVECLIAQVRWCVLRDESAYKLYAGVQFRFAEKQQDMITKYVYRLQQDIMRRRRGR